MSDNKQTINYKIEKLDENIEWFYSDDFSLDAAVEKFRQTVELAKEVDKDLAKMKNEIEILAEDFTK